MERAPEYDIAIVGLGPVGSTAAILLADAGLQIIAFERDPLVYQLPRAVALDGEIIRAFQSSGRSGDVVKLLQPFREGDRFGFANSKREWLFGQEPRAVGRNGWPATAMFDQPEFEGWLRATAVDHPNVTAPSVAPSALSTTYR
ncbi:MAG: 3-(3-hydroxy-phenyl)propionate hydroxylase [Acidimicrobiales bacterium]